MKNKVRFAVYGTLRKGNGNHRLLQDAEYLGTIKTEPIYTMVSLGGFPAVKENGNTSIVCEIYETDDEDIIKSVFRLEGCTGVKGHPNNWYDFVELDTNWGKANMFTMNTCNSKVEIENGDWNKYRGIQSAY